MAEARSEQLWDQTSELLAMLVNVNRTKKGRSVTGKTFHPHKQRERRQREPGEGKLGFAQLKRAVSEAAGKPMRVTWDDDEP